MDLLNPGKTQRLLIVDIKQALFHLTDSTMGELIKKLDYIGFETEPQSNGGHVVSGSG